MEKNTMISNCKVIIIGGSAGSLQVLMDLLPSIPMIDSFAIVIVLHRRASDDLTLEELIKVKANIPVKIIEDKVPFKLGYLYVAPANYHLLLEKNNTMALDTSGKVNFSRPSIDVSFESVSEIYGNTVIGILLSGSNSDGTAGLKAIQKAGGLVIVQDPTSAEMPFMPINAIQNITPDYVLNTQEILDFILSVNNKF